MLEAVIGPGKRDQIHDVAAFDHKTAVHEGLGGTEAGIEHNVADHPLVSEADGDFGEASFRRAVARLAPVGISDLQPAAHHQP